MQAGKLAVLGSINVDHILDMEEFPSPGETVTGNRYQVAFGGKGANQAVAAGRSGAAISFIACVGDDDLGARIRKQLVSDQIQTQSVGTIAQTATGVALIFVDGKGENFIGIHSGANAALTPAYVEQHSTVITAASALLMQLESPLESVISAARIAKKHQTAVVLNPAPARDLPDELLAMVDIITPNKTEAERLTGIKVNNDAAAARAARALHAKGIDTVIITLGNRGVWLSRQGKGRRIAGFPVVAVDTIAAGDTFNGALLTALLEGKELEEAVVFAHAAAAISVTRRGAQPSIPWRKEIDAFLQQHG